MKRSGVSTTTGKKPQAADTDQPDRRRLRDTNTIAVVIEEYRRIAVQDPLFSGRRIGQGEGQHPVLAGRDGVVVVPCGVAAEGAEATDAVREVDLFCRAAEVRQQD